MSLLSKLALSGVCLALTLPSYAQPLISLGDNIDISAQVTGAVQFNDNIFLDPADEESDILLIMSPGLELTYSQPNVANLTIAYIHDVVTYTDNDAQNRDNPNFYLSGDWTSVKTQLTYSASYRDITQNTSNANLTGELADRTETKGSVRCEWDMSMKSSIAVGANYLNFDFNSPALRDREEVSVPVNYYWEYTPKLDLSVGYRYRNTSYGSIMYPAVINGVPVIVTAPDQPDSEDHFLNVGMRGELSAKTTGEIRVGYQNRDFGGDRGDKGQFSVDMSLDWAASPKMLYTINASRDFKAGSTGASYTTNEFEVIGQYALDEEWSCYGSMKYLDDNYSSGATNNTYFSQIGARYSPNIYSSFTLAYTFYKNDSSIEESDFTSNIFNLSASLRY